MGLLNNWLKKYLLVFQVKDRWSAQTQASLRNLYLNHQSNARNGIYHKLSDTGLSVFSQFEEDGMVLYLFSLLGMQHKTFIEIGSDDGINSNSANLYFNFGWAGVFIDGNKKSLERGRHFYAKYPNPFMHKPQFIHAMVCPESINELLKQSKIEGQIGFMSIDIDSNDYYIWEAINCIEPQVVMIETQVAMGHRAIVAPYISPSEYGKPRHRMYHGASAPAMVDLGKKKGYRLVGSNHLGFNLIFIRENLLQKEVPTISYKDILKHPSVVDGMNKFKGISGYGFLELEDE